MTYTILHVGKVKNRTIAALIDDYAERAGHDVRIQRVIIKDANDPRREGAEILAKLEKHRGIVITLSEEGMRFTSTAFAQKLQSFARDVAFVIGGPTGLSDEVRSRADEILSLSPMTFTHEMAQLLLFEQLYRAQSIMHNRKYHKE